MKRRTSQPISQLTSYLPRNKGITNTRLAPVGIAPDFPPFCSEFLLTPCIRCNWPNIRVTLAMDAIHRNLLCVSGTGLAQEQRLLLVMNFCNPSYFLVRVMPSSRSSK